MRTVLTSVRGSFLTLNRYSRQMYAFEQELRSHESWSEQAIAEYQRQALQRIVEYARNTIPFYSSYPKLAWDSVDDVRKLPILTREVVRENSDRLIARGTMPGECVRVGTTGTTGANLKVAYSPQVARRNWAFRMRQWAWAGVRPRTPRGGGVFRYEGAGGPHRWGHRRGR